MAVTLHDVARLSGVSIKTVSNVINDYPHIRPTTREKVEAAIAELGYSPNLTARSLRSGRTGVIGLALPELSLAYFAELADMVMQAAEDRGLTVLIEQTRGERDREIQTLSSRTRALTDGLIFSPLGMGQEDAAALDVDFPLVTLGERIFGGPADHVTMQNVEAARAATEYLIGIGRRRIVVLGAHPGEEIGSAGLRLRGYREALEAAGIPYDDGLIGYSGPWHRENGAVSMRAVLESGVPFDAVFGLNDALALGGLRVLQQAGLRVPEDVAVMGFDNIDETQYALPSLSTVEPGRLEIARTAVAALIERIAERATGVEPAAPREIAAAFEVIGRESTVS
ncbi:LacI family DNA-binding transcriptional regulator [Microbacteriaceae bacterium VKM Ac-2855]|nr:LacI family DNA-binding transcriptional regulator [Microbacteriaceae bacterium VKM Ac-2855]